MQEEMKLQVNYIASVRHLKNLIDRLEKEQHTSKANMQEEMKLQVNYIASVRHLKKLIDR